MSTIPETLYEPTLVMRSQLGDEAAFEGLLELHGPRLLDVSKRIHCGKESFKKAWKGKTT
ncbi:MAG: hypothetical protein ABSH34_21155 [Verrucomicrobiota bacterium]|jgi:hypothetical protein